MTRRLEGGTKSLGSDGDLAALNEACAPETRPRAEDDTVASLPPVSGG